MSVQHVAVLGGGITGLSSAFHLSRTFPRSKITVIEKQNRLGGWLNSERVNVNGHNILLESGPRTLRPQSKAVLELIHLLKLEHAVIRTFSNTPAAQNRFIHVPGQQGLTLLPSAVLSLLKSRLLLTLMTAILRDAVLLNNRPADVHDESVDSFLTRRFGNRFARDFGSALVHGIYAADSRLLSVRAAFPSLWNGHLRGNGSVTRSMFRRRQPPTSKTSVEYKLGGMNEFMKGVSVFSFQNGTQQLVDSLKATLQKADNVEFIRSDVTAISPDESTISIQTDEGRFTPSHAVSTLPLPILSSILGKEKLPYLTYNPSSSVVVVNLIFDQPPENICPPGFGYLVPRRATDGSKSSGLEAAVLGTVFDSYALSEQDDTRKMTKLTVMLGGPHAMPQEIDTDELVSILNVHLSRQLPRPVMVKTHRHVDCIPIPTVGHLDRMLALKSSLESEPWNGRLAVIGAGVGGVSVGDCIEAGRNIASQWC